MNKAFGEIFRASREAAARLAFPPFVKPEPESTPLNATPYLAHLREAGIDGFLSNRTALLVELRAGLERLRLLGVEPVAALLGGSAIGPKERPCDLDCTIFYRVAPDVTPRLGELAPLQRDLRQRRLDVRLFPLDSDPLLLIKTVSFFTTLYSKHNTSLEIVRGLVLLDCRPEAPDLS